MQLFSLFYFECQMKSLRNTPTTLSRRIRIARRRTTTPLRFCVFLRLFAANLIAKNNKMWDRSPKTSNFRTFNLLLLTAFSAFSSPFPPHFHSPQSRRSRAARRRIDSRLWTLYCLFFHPLKFTRYQTLFGVQDYLNINKLCLPSFTNSRFADFLKKWNINASDKILK